MKQISTKQIGDNKLPNQYWVSISNDYYYFNQEVEAYDWISDLKLFEVKSATIAKFNTYKEASDYAYNIPLGSDCDGIRANAVTIEDRLSGEVFCKCFEFYPASGEISETSREDIGYTKNEMQKRGKVMV